MSAPVEFAAFEHAKENIEPTREGRSAASLAAVFGNNSSPDAEPERLEFEDRIKDSDLDDDPLQVWLDYINWTKDRYPQGQTTQSNLVPLLERATSRFVKVPHYKNDVRYVKTWMSYAKYADSPREVFTHLASLGIGTQLALYYEDYAAWLETNGHKNKANEVYQAGLENNAHPAERLQRRYHQFCERCAANPPDPGESTSPAFPTVRAALSSKLGAGPLGDAAPSGGVRKKLAVFVDEGDPEAAPSGAGFLGTNAVRRKENVMQATPWAGETLPSSSALKPAHPKLSVFREVSAPKSEKDNERISIDMDLLYDSGREYCLEEVYARSRGLLGKKYPTKPETPKAKTTTIMLKEDSPTRPRPATPTMTLHTKGAMDDIYDMFNQPLGARTDGNSNNDDDEDNNDDNDPDHESDQDQIWERDVTSEFTESLQRQQEQQSEYSRHVAQRYTVTESPRPYSAETPYRYVKNDTPYSASPAYDVPKYVESVLSPHGSPAPAASLTDSVRRRKRLERSEGRSPSGGTPSRPPVQAQAQVQAHVQKRQQLMQQKFQQQIKQQQQQMQQLQQHTQKQQSPSTKRAAIKHQPKGGVVRVQQQPFRLAGPPAPFNTLRQPTYNPLDKRLRSLLTQTALGRLEKAPSLFQSKQTGLGISAKVSGRNALFLDLQPYGTIKVHKKLGEGGFASVYLADEVEKGRNNQSFALKVEKPASIWEFYILYKMRQNMGVGPLQTPPLRIHSAHLFKNESVLVMDRFKGTILDAVNKMGGQLGECVTLMWTLDLLTAVESMHRNGILHCDIKPDNIMVDNSDERQAIIIDYGRSLDMSLFHDGVAFVADWQTDNQDCFEMRKRQKWTYQTDFYGVAACIFTMLHGSFIETTFKDGRHQFARGWKRYWQQDIWLPLVDFLLNPNKVCGIKTGEFNWPSDCAKTKRELEIHRVAIQRYLDDNTKAIKDTLRSIREVLK